MKILIVDFRVIGEAMQSLLQGVHEVRIATNLNEALGELATETFDLVLSEIRIGDEHPFSIASEIRARYPATPVALLSTSAGDAQKQRASELGLAGLISKGIRRDVFLREIARVTSGS